MKPYKEHGKHTVGDARIIGEKLEALKRSSFRARFRLRTPDIGYVTSRGMETIRNHAVDFITARIAPANPANDGRQTPMRNHPVFIAQHATATCCRGCLEKWHNIPKGRALNDEEIGYIADVIMAWIRAQTE
ncbi:DUF4186 domain-containing protein [bacterium]|nr:DUF4186 domain-containing protein [bacterium]